MMALRGDLFRGSIEDRYVGAFLEDTSYEVESRESRADRIALAIEVLRVAALSSYENRPISSGVLLLDTETDPLHAARDVPDQALHYSHVLTAIKSFHRLCDGVHTLFLVNSNGLILDIVDIAQWASRVSPGEHLPVPCAQAFVSHALATIANRNVCIVLSPSHEIKVFSGGMQTFTFRNAAWHLLDLRANYSRWMKLVGNFGVAERLFQTALDLADARKGALFVVVRNPSEALAELIAPADRLDVPVSERSRDEDDGPSRRQLLYLLANRTVVDMDSSILAALGSLDGATVVDGAGRLLAAGAILLHPVRAVPARGQVEGARTTAAMAASRYGTVLKVSEDGIITLLDGDTSWHM